MRHALHSLTHMRLHGAVLVVIAVGATLFAMGAATMVLVLAMLAAFMLWAREPARLVARPRRLVAMYAAGWGVLCVHGAEEYLTGFHREFPRWFGYEWTSREFLTFNIVWLLLFGLAGFGLTRGAPLACLVAWFFALGAGIANGSGHLVFSLVLGRYFPGTITAPLCLALGILILRELTRPAYPPSPATP